jgi:hypothetical protein
MAERSSKRAAPKARARKSASPPPFDEMAIFRPRSRPRSMSWGGIPQHSPATQSSMWSQFRGRQRSSSMFAAPSGNSSGGGGGSGFVGASFARFAPSEWEALRQQRISDAAARGGFDAPPLFRRNSREDEQRTANSPRSKEACELLGNRMSARKQQPLLPPPLGALQPLGGARKPLVLLKPDVVPRALALLATSVTAADAVESDRNPLSMLATLGALGVATAEAIPALPSSAAPSTAPAAAAVAFASAASAAAAPAAAPAPSVAQSSSSSMMMECSSPAGSSGSPSSGGDSSSGKAVPAEATNDASSSEDEAYRRFAALETFTGRRGRTRSSSLSIAMEAGAIEVQN